MNDQLPTPDDIVAVPEQIKKEMTTLEELEAKSRFLELYAARDEGVSLETICQKVKVPERVAMHWFEDRAFKSQIAHINERRIERVLEIFAESAVSVAKKTVETALSNGRYQQRAAALIFDALGIRKTREAIVSIQENNLVIRTEEDLEKARQRSSELDTILNSVKSVRFGKNDKS